LLAFFGQCFLGAALQSYPIHADLRLLLLRFFLFRLFLFFLFFLTFRSWFRFRSRLRGMPDLLDADEFMERLSQLVAEVVTLFQSILEECVGLLLLCK